MILNGKKILFLGDSITEGHGSSDKSKCYVSLIGEREGAECVNYGIGGTRITPQIDPSAKPERDKNNFINRVDTMDDNADIVVVFGGTNDFGHGDVPLGTMCDRRPITFYGGLHTLCVKLINKYPSSQIVFITPLHRFNEDSPYGDGPHAKPATAPLYDYVNAVRKVTEYYSLPLIDLYATSGIQPAIPKMKEMYMPDGLHPNDAGYDILAKKITTFLKSL